VRAVRFGGEGREGERGGKKEGGSVCVCVSQTSTEKERESVCVHVCERGTESQIRILLPPTVM
jgi:hypothetical protein